PSFSETCPKAVAQTNDGEQEKAILNFPGEFVARICCSEKLKRFIATADISADKTLSEALNDGLSRLMNIRISNSTAQLIYAAVTLLSLAIAFWLKIL